MNIDTLHGKLLYKLANAPVNPFPFPHIYIRDFFPEDFFAEMMSNLPPAGDYSTGKSNYNGRQFANPANEAFAALRDPRFAQLAAAPFLPWLKERFPTGQVEPHFDLRLVRDRQHYAIGPHTDAPWKVLSYLFYLNGPYEYGTSIYLPKDRNFRCPGGPHHKFTDFTRIYTAPFETNSVFAFFKTDQSFHGVEPIPIQCQRDVLLWNFYDTAARNGKNPP